LPPSTKSGAAVAVAVGAIFDAPLGIASAIGGTAAIASFILLRRYETGLVEAGAGGHGKVLYPSPGGGGE
jgi:hypothetical protein